MTFSNPRTYRELQLFLRSPEGVQHRIDKTYERHGVERVKTDHATEWQRHLQLAAKAAGFSHIGDVVGTVLHEVEMMAESSALEDGIVPSHFTGIATCVRCGVVAVPGDGGTVQACPWCWTDWADHRRELEEMEPDDFYESPLPEKWRAKK